MDNIKLVSAAYMLDPEATKAILENELNVPCMSTEAMKQRYEEALDESGWEGLNMDPARVLKNLAPAVYRANLYDTMDGVELDEDQAEESFDELLRDQGMEVLANYNISPSEVVKEMDDTSYRLGFNEYCEGFVDLSDGMQRDVLPSDSVRQVPILFAERSDVEDIDGSELFTSLQEHFDNHEMDVPLLQFAAREGDVSLCRELVEAGVDVNSTLPDGNTALHQAAAAGREDATAYLIDEGADPSAKNKRNQSPVDLAFSPQVRAHLETGLLDRNTAQAPARYATDDWAPTPEQKSQDMGRLTASLSQGGDDEERRPVRARGMRL